MVRLGILGCGRLCQRYYLPAFSRIDDVQIVAVADPLPVSLLAAKKLLPEAVQYASFEDLLAERSLDGVLVAAPPSAHLPILSEALKRRTPVFMEKPVVLDGEWSRVRMLPEARRLLMINFNRRFWPTYRQLAAWSQNGVIGELVEARFTLQVNVLAWGSVTQHRLQETEGGALHDLGSQVMDLAAATLGEDPVSLRAGAWSERWTGDHVRLSLQFASGAEAHCELAYENRTKESAMVRGTKGVLRLEDPNMAVHVSRNGAPTGPVSRCTDLCLLCYRGLHRSQSMARNSIAASIAAFVTAIREGSPFWPGFAEAAKNALWLEAACHSLSTGQAVELGAREVC